MNDELIKLRALRDFLLGYERSEQIRDDYWDGSKEEYMKEYLQEAVQMAKESQEGYERQVEAKSYCRAGWLWAATTPEPAGQKFPIGTRVRIADDLGRSMKHFPSGCNATVEYTDAHAFGGDVKSYALIVDGIGSEAWYDESQLTEITEYQSSQS